MSALISFTEKGRKVIEGLKDVALVEHPFDVVAEGQMRNNAKDAPFHNIITNRLVTLGRIDNRTILLINLSLKLRRVFHWFVNPRKTIHNAINKIMVKG